MVHMIVCVGVCGNIESHSNVNRLILESMVKMNEFQ